MLKPNRVKFWYLGPTWTRSPIGTGIALMYNPGSRGLIRHPTLCRNISQGRNPGLGVLLQLEVLLALGVLK